MTSKKTNPQTIYKYKCLALDCDVKAAEFRNSIVVDHMSVSPCCQWWHLSPEN